MTGCVWKQEKVGPVLIWYLGMGRLRAQEGMQVEIIGGVVIHRGLVLGPSLMQDTKIS